MFIPMVVPLCFYSRRDPSFVFLWSWPLIFLNMVVTLDHFWFIPLVVILMYFTLDVTLHLWFSRHFFLLGRDPYVLTWPSIYVYLWSWPLCFLIWTWPFICGPLAVTLYFFTLVVTFEHSWLIPLVVTLKSWLFTAVVTLDLFRIIPLVVTLMFRLWTWRIHLWFSRLFF